MSFSSTANSQVYTHSTDWGSKSEMRDTQTGVSAHGWKTTRTAVRVRTWEIFAFICFQRLMRQLLTESRVLRAHDLLWLQVQHGLGVRGPRRRLQLLALDLHLHVRRDVHALLVHGAVVQRGGLLMLLELLGKLVSSKHQRQSAQLGAVKTYSHEVLLCEPPITR